MKSTVGCSAGHPQYFVNPAMTRQNGEFLLNIKDQNGTVFRISSSCRDPLCESFKPWSSFLAALLTEPKKRSSFASSHNVNCASNSVASQTTLKSWQALIGVNRCAIYAGRAATNSGTSQPGRLAILEIEFSKTDDQSTSRSASNSVVTEQALVRGAVVDRRHLP
jgi:hypothetical protein